MLVTKHSGDLVVRLESEGDRDTYDASDDLAVKKEVDRNDSSEISGGASIKRQILQRAVGAFATQHPFLSFQREQPAEVPTASARGP